MADEPPHVWPRSVSLQHEQAPFAIHRVKSLLQIKEDAIEGALLQVGQLLGQFGLDNGRPGAAFIPASM